MDLLMQRMMALPVEATDNSYVTEQKADVAFVSLPVHQWADSHLAPEPESVPFKLANSQATESTTTENVAHQPKTDTLHETAPVPTILRPLVLINQPFDWLWGRLGPVGRFLIGPKGRGLFAWAGLLLIVVGLAWLVAEGLGLDLIELSQ
jgi:hypothetical protein